MTRCLVGSHCCSYVTDAPCVFENARCSTRAVDGGRINIAACSVGGAQFCVDHATEYVASRQQFGQPVGRFQNTQFRLADMATGVSASRLMVRWAAVGLGHPCAQLAVLAVASLSLVMSRIGVASS